MTVSSQTSSETFHGNGVTTVWDLPFRFFLDSDLLVYRVVVATGVVTLLVQGTDYTLYGAGLPEQFGTAPGKITTTTPLPNGSDLTVTRVMLIEQLVDIINQGRFFPEVHEDVFDRLTMLIQQSDFSQSRAIRVPDTDPEPNRLPPYLQRAGGTLGFDSAGQPIIIFTSSGSATELALALADPADPFKGANLVGYHGRTVHARLDDNYNVIDAGADTTGVLDASAVFGAYIQSRPAAVSTYAPYLTIARAPISIGYIPAGTYRLNSLVDTGGRDVIWIADAGAIFINPDNLNGKLERPGSRISDKTHTGALDYACSFSVQGGMPLESPAGVLGIINASDLSTYVDRDTVGLYAANRLPPLVADVASATYTATTIVPGVPLTADQIKLLRVGMIIDTKHATKYSGFITGWAANGTSITVSSWYLAGGPGTPATPANGTGARVNPFTKGWAVNANVWVEPDSYASASAAFELGVGNNKAAYDPATNANNHWCYDAITVGQYLCETAFLQRGYYFKGFESRGATGYAFIAKNEGPTYQSFATFCSQTSTQIQFIVQPPSQGGKTSYQIDVGGNVEMGRNDIAAAVNLDLHSSGTSSDYDVRMSCSGGSASNGNGTLTFEGGSYRFQGAPGYVMNNVAFVPLIDAARSLGQPTFRFNTVYAATGTINTSDAREKTPVRKLTAAEIKAASRLAKEIGAYRFLVSVDEKGDDAREHIGMTVQRAIEIMGEEGLEPFSYGFICHDEWGDDFITHAEQTKLHPAVTETSGIPDGQGNPTTTKILEEEWVEVTKEAWTEQVQFAGDRYAFRYEELLAFIAAGADARATAQDDLIASMMDRLEALEAKA